MYNKHLNIQTFFNSRGIIEIWCMISWPSFVNVESQWFLLEVLSYLRPVIESQLLLILWLWFSLSLSMSHRFYRLRNRDWKRCVSREWSVLRAKCILFDARLPGVRTKTLLLYRYRACGGCYSQIKVPDRRQWWCFTRSGLLQKGLAFGALPISDTRRQFNCKKLRTWARLSWS